ncbi:TPA: hypothetical protein I7145_13310 [Vibrio vulnificus]|nr:hypothetical protein [Vibrio vulnificus]
MIDTLLKQVSLINLKYEKLQEARGIDFNIFSILRKENDEVALHSRFIGELLDPNGTHGKGYLFQSLFFSQINKEQSIKKDCYTLHIERKMGCHGRIDLLLIGERNVVVIENKIHAKDQVKQLERYSNALSKYYNAKNKHLIYLSLFGDTPSQESLGNLKQSDILCVSYSCFIQQWLTHCAREVYDSPHLRETIIQYRNLIEKLTGQTLGEDQKMELKSLILDEDNFKSALSIQEVMKDVQSELQKMIWIELQTSLRDDGYDFEFVNHKFEKVSLDVCENFYKTTNRDYHYGLQYEVLRFGDYGVHLYIEVEDRLYYGFTVSKCAERGIFKEELLCQEPELKSNLDSLIDSAGDCEWWLAWKYSADKINFRNFQEGNSSKLSNSFYRSKWVNDVKDDVVKLIKQCKEIF